MPVMNMSRIDNVDTNILDVIQRMTIHETRGSALQLPSPIPFCTRDGIWKLEAIDAVDHFSDTESMIIIGSGTINWHEGSFTRQTPHRDTKYKLKIELNLQPRKMTGMVEYRVS